MPARVARKVLVGLGRFRRALTGTLRNRIVIMTSVLVLLATGLVGTIEYLRVEDSMRRAAVERLAGETRLVAQKFESSFDLMRSDTEILSRTPPIDGIIRATRNDGIDPLDSSTSELWRARLNTIFASVMAMRESYTQMRLIGIADGGRELVRVNRQGVRYLPVNAQNLQQKGKEPYFQDVIGSGSAEVQFSAVTMNREQGEISPDLTPTIRSIKPVFDQNGALFAMLVINADYRILVREAFEQIAPNNKTIVVNGTGDHIEYDPETGISELLHHEMHGDVHAPLEADILTRDTNENVSQTPSEVSYFVRLTTDQKNPDADLGVITSVPLNELLAEVHRTREVAIYTGLALVVLCTILSFFIARRFTDPLHSMAERIRKGRANREIEGLPVEREDEIGELARAFRRRTGELKDAEMRSSAVIDNVVDGVITIDENGIIESYNPGCEKIFGYGAEEAVGRSISILMPKNLREQHARYLDRAHVTSHQVIGKTRELQGLRKNGERFPMELAISELELDNRRLFSGIIRDVSEQRKITKALEEAENRWNNALTGAQIGVFDINLVTGSTIVSPTWKEMLGFDVEAEMDHQAEWKARVHPDDLPMIEERDNAVFEGRSEKSISEYRFFRTDGEMIWMRSEATVVDRAADGTALRYVGTQVDITEIKRAEEARELSEARLRSAMDNAPIGTALVDLDGRFMRVNEAFSRFLGYSKEELRDTDFQTITVAEDLEEDMANIKRLLSGEVETYQMEKRYVTKHGHEVWGLLSVSLARDADGEPAYFISQILDISEQREIDRMKSEFVSNVSHELRTPLTSIRGSLGLIAGAMNKDVPEGVMKLVNIAHKNSERLILLVNDILDVEKLRAEKLKFDLEETDVTTQAHQAVEALQGFADQFEVTLNLKAPEAPDVAMLDKDRFQQVLANLISNAAKFSPRGGTVDITVRYTDGSVRVLVADQGPGVPASFRASIFSPFSQADGSATREKGGTGLGLHITKQMVERMGGRIDFNSAEGFGSTFWVDFPIAHATENKLVDEIPDLPLVLHVEDDTDFSTYLATALSDRMVVINAPTLEEGLKEVRDPDYDLIIVDLNLPDGSGMKVIDALPQDNEKPVVILTAEESQFVHPRAKLHIVKSRMPESKVIAAIASLLNSEVSEMPSRRQKIAS